jgi:aspartyl-tRNA(Asn)/glutamyl-tRNA(Gln) amidotransferase subunit B
MEKGSMRLEANVSVSTQEGRIPNYKVELKNINSFRFLEKGINSEIDRQISLLKAGKKVIQETRGYNEKTGTTISQRTKEEAQDYRYFPEPDIPPLVFRQEEIEGLKKGIPELPRQKAKRFSRDYALPENYIDILIQDVEKSNYFEEAVKVAKDSAVSAKTVADFIVNKGADSKFPEPAGLVKHLSMIGKRQFAQAFEVEKAVGETLAREKKAVADYQAGKAVVVGYLVGAVQKKLAGRGDPSLIGELIIKNLQKKTP